MPLDASEKGVSEPVEPFDGNFWGVKNGPERLLTIQNEQFKLELAFGWFAASECNAAGLGMDFVGIQRQGAKPPRRNRIFLLRNQETRNHQKDFMVSGLPYGIVFGCVFASLR